MMFDAVVEEAEIQLNGLIQDGGAAARRVVQTIGGICKAFVWIVALLCAFRIGAFMWTSGSIKAWIKRLFLLGGQNLEGNVENNSKQRAEALVARLRGRAALGLVSGGAGYARLPGRSSVSTPPQKLKVSEPPLGGRPPPAPLPPPGAAAAEEQARASPAARVTLYKIDPGGELQICFARNKQGAWAPFELEGPGVPGACQALAKAGGELTSEEQESLRVGSVRVGFDRQGVQTTFVSTSRPLVEVFCRWDVRDREIVKVAWIKPVELPDGCDEDLARVLETAFGDLSYPVARRSPRMPGCLEGIRRLGGRSAAPAAASGALNEDRGSEPQRSAVGRSPGPDPVNEPFLEIKRFPEALDSVVGIMSVAQRELMFTCYTVDHPRVLSLVQEKLRAGV
jgi:hypothetical protein